MYNSICSFDSKGREILDETPISIGVHFDRPTPLHIRIRQQILQMMQEQQYNSEVETFEDADDFDIDDDPVPSSPYEMEDDFDHLNESKWDKETKQSVEDAAPSTGAASETDSNSAASSTPSSD